MSTTATTADHSGDTSPFEHIGLLYRTEADYLAGVVPFVEKALSDDSPVLVVLPTANLDLVRAALGADARRVEFADMTRAGRNPGRLLPGVLLRFADAHPRQRASIVGEPVWPDRSDTEYPACVAHEALINTVFAERDAAVLCPYDTHRLDARAVADAHRTHPVVEHGGKRRSSDAYTDPLELVGEFNQPLPQPPTDASVLDYAGRTALGEVRHFVTRQAEEAGFSEDRAAELAIAVNELAANTIEHTPSGGRLAVWTEPGLLVCHVEDTGHLLDPLAGRLPPAAIQPRGRGLVFVNQLCDLVRVHTRPGRTEFRLHFHF